MNQVGSFPNIFSLYRSHPAATACLALSLRSYGVILAARARPPFLAPLRPVTSVEISDGYANDHNFYKALLETTAGNGFKMAEVSADKAYLSGENLLTTLRHEAIPYILFKTNSKPSALSTYGAK
jgi:hypothetical protein